VDADGPLRDMAFRRYRAAHSRQNECLANCSHSEFSWFTSAPTNWSPRWPLPSASSWLFRHGVGHSS